MSGENAQNTMNVYKPDFGGTYDHVRNENFEEFLAANGANWMIRKMASKSSPTLIVTQDGDKFTFKLNSLVTSKQFSFTVGEGYEETQQGGAVMNVTPAWDGDKLVLTFKPKEEGVGKEQTHTREVIDGEMTMTLAVGDVVAKRIFKKRQPKVPESKTEENVETIKEDGIKTAEKAETKAEEKAPEPEADKKEPAPEAPAPEAPAPDAPAE